MHSTLTPQPAQFQLTLSQKEAARELEVVLSYIELEVVLSLSPASYGLLAQKTL